MNEVESPHTSARYYSIIAVIPTFIEMNAVVTNRRQGGLGQLLSGWFRRKFGKKPEGPADPFDEEILVDVRGWMDESGGGKEDCLDPKAGDVTGQLLTDPTIRRALIEAARGADRVHLHSTRLVLCSSTSTAGFDPAKDLDGMSLASLALAVALERWARKEPRGRLREGTRERGDSERLQYRYQEMT